MRFCLVALFLLTVARFPPPVSPQMAYCTLSSTMRVPISLPKLLRPAVSGSAMVSPMRYPISPGRGHGSLRTSRPLSLTPARSSSGDTDAVPVPVRVDESKGSSVLERQPSRGAMDVSPFGLMDPMAPMRTMRQMLDMMDRLFDDAMSFPGSPRQAGDIRAPWDVSEDEHQVRMRFDMPGLSREDVRVSVDDDVLVVKGERKETDAEKHDDWTRRSSTAYDMSLLIDDDWETDNVRAEFKNGVLFVTVPKKKVERKVVDVHVH